MPTGRKRRNSLDRLPVEERVRRTWKGPRFVGEEVSETTETSRELEGMLRTTVALRPERELNAPGAHERPSPETQDATTRLTGEPEKGWYAAPEILDAIECSFWEALVRRLEVEHRESGNALYAWKTWALAREFKRPLPEWVSEYLDTCAGRLLACAERPPTNVGRALGRALGFLVSRGRGSEFSAFAALRRHVGIADTVRLAREGGATWEQAFARAAKLHEMSETTVRAAWRELRERLPQRASFWARAARNRVGK